MLLTNLTPCLNCTALLHTNEWNGGQQTSRQYTVASVPVRRLIDSGPQRATRIMQILDLQRLQVELKHDCFVQRGGRARLRLANGMLYPASGKWEGRQPAPGRCAETTGQISEDD